MTSKLCLGLSKGVTLLVVVLPDLAVVPQVAQPLHGEADGDEYTQDGSDDPRRGPGLDHVEQTIGSCRGDAEEEVDGEGKVDPTEEEVDVVEEGMLLHEAVIDWSIP